MNKVFNLLREKKVKNGLKVIAILVVGLIVVSNVEVTYADKATHTIVFNRAEGTEVMLTCKTGSDGKVSSSCASCVANICARWSYEKYNWSNSQTTVLYSSALATTVFTGNTDYYCVAGSSKPDANYCSSVEDACFVCSTDKNVMKWDKDGSSDSACAAGYYETDKPKTECKTKTSCYVCKSDKNVMKWSTNGSKDSACSSGYTETDTPEKDCVTKKPVCYVCNNDKNVMKWDTNGNKDGACSGGYTETDTPETDCVTKKPVCYVCNNNSNVMKWDITGESDDICSEGYYETDTPEVDCVTKVPEIEVENTASSKSVLTIILATVITAIGASIIYGIRKNY